MKKNKRVKTDIPANRLYNYLDSFIPKDQLEAENKYKIERTKILQKHPKYLSIAKRLDENIFNGILDNIENIKEVLNQTIEYINNNIEDKDKDKEILINLSPVVIKALSYSCNIIEFTNVDLDIYKYRGYYICKAPELSDLQFNVYTLLKE